MRPHGKFLVHWNSDLPSIKRFSTIYNVYLNIGQIVVMNIKSKANIIFHSYSVASASWSALTAVIPVIGPGCTGILFRLTAITMAMAYSLSGLFGKGSTKQSSVIWEH